MVCNALKLVAVESVQQTSSYSSGCVIGLGQLVRVRTHIHIHIHMHAHIYTSERLVWAQVICIVKKVPVFVICMYNSEYQKYERNKDVELFLYVMQTEWLYKFNNH